MQSVLFKDGLANVTVVYIAHDLKGIYKMYTIVVKFVKWNFKSFRVSYKNPKFLCSLQSELRDFFFNLSRNRILNISLLNSILLVSASVPLY